METKEKQMTIDDYLNRDQVAIMPGASEVLANTNAEVLEAEPVDYTHLTKEQLISCLMDRDKVILNYEDKIKNDEEARKTETENLNHFYTQRTNELANLVSYYERKLKVLGDIINMETGGVK